MFPLFLAPESNSKASRDVIVCIVPRTVRVAAVPPAFSPFAPKLSPVKSHTVNVLLNKVDIT